MFTPSSLKQTLASLLLLASASVTFAAKPSAEVTSFEDRNQMMDQLGIEFPELPPKLEDPNRPANAWPRDADQPDGNWTDADKNTITRTAFGLWVTYDDDKAGEYTPIDLLKMNDGSSIQSKTEWWEKRRPEIFQNVQEQLFGFMPDKSQLPSVIWNVHTSTHEGDVNYIEQTITGNIDISSYPEVRDAPKIVGTLRIPANAEGPVPVIIILGTRGLDTIWEMVAPEGWAVCTFDNNKLQPDNGAALTSYLIGLVNKGNWRKPDDWGSLVATSWGVGQLIDYFETNENIDATKVGLSGHSRWGKATMVAMAYEPRLAISYPSCGGALGPSMIRRHWGQNLENLSWDREYHWTSGNLFKWMGPLNEGDYWPRKVENLTVDAHSLVALCAPRPIFLNGGSADTWSDAPGTYLTAVAASPAYEFLGAKGIRMNDNQPKLDVSYDDGDIAYRVHDGGHTPMPDWPAFIEFARRYLND